MELSVYPQFRSLLLGELFARNDCFARTNACACATIDTSIGVNFVDVTF